MIDWEEIIRTESTEELKEAKLWLFQENMRLQQERTELEQAKDKFLEERVTLRDELDALNRRTVMERKRLKEESLFFDYYLGQRLGEWTKNYGSAATERKIYVGKGIRYFSNIGVAEFLVEAAEVSVGDKLLITGPTTGAEFVTLDEARVDLKPVQTVKKGQHFSMKSVKIRPSDKLYKLVSVEELKKFKGLDVEKQRG